MNEKDKAIAQAMASIQNRLRHVYNQGFEDGRKAERKQQVTKEDIEIWLNKWDGYIDKDIIARMCYRISDIFKIAQKRADQEADE